ncbi:MAG: hypothetical protein J5671_08375, partial [Bacteroidaceae bacterium]|nr:hypothetical protein [Bacteroidaceae bacterium]
DLRHLSVGETFVLETGKQYYYISGPVRKLTDTTFEIIPYDCGTDNPKRSHSAWIVAVREGDSTHKRTVQPIQIVLR